MARARTAVAITTLLVTGSVSLQGWGDDGHRLVARIAAQAVSPATRTRLVELLSIDPACAKENGLEHQLACVASWADPPLKDQRPYTANWHFVDIPLISTPTQPTVFQTHPLNLSEQCEMQDRGDCAILALRRLQFVLANGREAPVSRLEALKFIVHIIGDVHQPMHDVTHKLVADPMTAADDLGDLGGNFKAVRWLGADINPRWNSQWNLHSVWDEGVLDRLVTESGNNKEKYVATLLKRARDVTAAQKAEWTKGDVGQWVVEGYQLAVTVAYGRLPTYDPTYQYKTSNGSPRKGGYVLTADYFHAVSGPVEEQLVRGGLRLASALDLALAQH